MRSGCRHTATQPPQQQPRCFGCVPAPVPRPVPQRCFLPRKGCSLLLLRAQPARRRETLPSPPARGRRWRSALHRRREQCKSLAPAEKQAERTIGKRRARLSRCLLRRPVDKAFRLLGALRGSRELCRCHGNNCKTNQGDNKRRDSRRHDDQMNECCRPICGLPLPLHAAFWIFEFVESRHTGMGCESRQSCKA